MEGLILRPMAPHDLPRVVEIEESRFTSPWSPRTFEELLERPAAELWVAELPGAGVVGYGVLWCILDQGELANIAVHPEWGGRRVGRALLRRLLSVGRGRGVRAVFLEVRVSNAPAIALYRSFGFREVGQRRAYYERPREDALVMRLDLPPPPG